MDGTIKKPKWKTLFIAMAVTGAVMLIFLTALGYSRAEDIINVIFFIILIGALIWGIIFFSKLHLKFYGFIYKTWKRT